jgi:hypothetical protein
LHLHDLRSSVWRDAPDREWQISLIETDALQLTMPNQIDVAHHVAHRQWARERATVIDEPPKPRSELPELAAFGDGREGRHLEAKKHLYEVSPRVPSPTTSSSVCSMQELANPSASIHPKRFSTRSFTHKVLYAGNLNPRGKKPKL